MPTPRKYPNDAAKKKAYRDRKKQVGGLPEGSALSPEADTTPAVEAVATSKDKNRARLELQADHAPLPADRIRATTELIKLDVLEAQTRIAEEHGGLVALKSVMDSLPAHERVAALDRMLVSTPGDIVLNIEKETP